MNQSLNELLKQTSRSFYLTLRILPGAVRSQIGLAYLLARTTDTVADTDLVSVERRLQTLAELRARILGQSDRTLDFGELARQQGSTAERQLLEHCEDSLAYLKSLPPADVELIRGVLDTITSGQELDLRRFADAGRSSRGDRTGEETGAPVVVALRTEQELDDYTYRVAGCVGEFWTKLCRTHLFPQAQLDVGRLLTNGVRFGKGLQLVNILRDIPADLRKGRCYLPADGLAELHLFPDDLLRPANEQKLRPLFNVWLNRARDHLAAGWDYTNTLPRGQMRVRLACAWPILIGLKTIERLKSGEVLDPQKRIKVPRTEVRALMIQSVVRYPFPRSWRKMGLTHESTR